MVGESDVNASGQLGDLANRGHVGIDVAVQLLVAELGEGLDLEALVGVLDIDGKQAVDVGVVDLDPLDLRLAVLAEQVHLMPQTGERPSEVGVVDVAAGAAQHVAVKDENAHRDRGSY